MDPEPAKSDAEVREPGELCFLRQPVEPVRPVGDQFAEVVDVGPERPRRLLGGVRPSRRPQPRPQVIERRGSLSAG